MKPAPEELQLVISQGTIWYLLNKYEISQTDQFTKLYQNSEGFGVDTSNPNTINFMDYSDVSLSGNSLINMSVGYYKKDMVVVTPSNEAYYIYATTQWPTIEEAKEAPLPDVPDSIRNSVVRSAALIIEQSTLGVIEVLDIRPMFTKLFETGSAASNATVISHSDLANLGFDDHLQYHNDTRGDIRYYRKSEVDALVNSKADLNHTHTNATSGVSGFMSNTDKSKLDGIQTNATANSTDSFLLDRNNHTGTQLSSTISDFNTNVDSRINSRIQDQIVDGVTLNAPSQNAVFDALSNKSNLGHNHSIAEITNLQTTLDNKSNTNHTHTSVSITDFDVAVRTAVVEDQIIDGVINKAPSQNSVFDALANKANSIHTHSSSQITDFNASVDSRINTRISNTSIDELNDVNTTNKSNGQVLTYNTVTSQWSPATPIVYGDMFKSTYDTNDNGVIDNSERLNNQLPTYYLSRSNHTGTQDVSTITGLTKAEVGLDNVDNTSDLNKPISTATQTALNNKENTIPAGLATDYVAGDKTIKPLNTNNVSESIDKRFVTDSQRTVLQNTSGVNSGDETTATIKTKLGVASATTEGYLTSTSFNTFNNKEPALPLGTSTQYFKGDKTLATLDKNAVGLGNVQNVDTTNAANITSGLLPLSRLEVPLQLLSDSVFSNDTVLMYTNNRFDSLPLTSSEDNMLFNYSGSGLDINAKYGNHPNNPYFSFMEHFIGTSATSTVSPYFLRTVNNGTTAAVSLSSDTDTRMGVLRLGTGALISSGAALGTSGMQSFNFASIPNGGYYETGCRFELPTLSDAAQTFSLVFGFGDATTAQPVDGVFLRHTTNTVVGRLVANSVITDIAIPNITNLAINTDYILKIRVSRDNSGVLSATFKLNGNEVTTTSGIPTGVARQTALQYAIIKSFGVNQGYVDLDWIYFERYFPEISNY